MSLIGLVYWTWELGGLPTQVGNVMTSIFDVFWGVPEAVFESCSLCSLFGDDRSLPKGLAPQSLNSVPLSELCFSEIFSLAATFCGNTWLVETLFDSLSNGPHWSLCADSKESFCVCFAEDRDVSLFDSRWVSLPSGSLDKASGVLDVNALSFRVFWLTMLSDID